MMMMMMNGEQRLDDEFDDRDQCPNGDAIAVARNIHFDVQRQFYIRFAKFLVTITIFCFLIMLTDFQHGGAFSLLFTILSGMFTLYMLGSLIMAMLIQNQLLQPGILTEGNTSNNQHDYDSEEEEWDSDDQRALPYSFEETPRQIRKCSSKIGFSHPADGLYTIVYAAIYFGKQIRSEAQMDLQFEVAREGNGWTIHGTSISGKQSPEGHRVISEGFVNARGEMYWKLSNPLGNNEKEDMSITYRGQFDFHSNSMFDGEFWAERVPSGRIVRLELLQPGHSSNNIAITQQANSRKDTNIEMVELGEGWD